MVLRSTKTDGYGDGTKAPAKGECIVTSSSKDWALMNRLDWSLGKHQPVVIVSDECFEDGLEHPSCSGDLGVELQADADHLGIDLHDLDSWDDTMLMAYVTRRFPRVGLKVLGPLLTGLEW